MSEPMDIDAASEAYDEVLKRMGPPPGWTPQAEGADEQQPFSPLVGAVLTQMFSDSRATTNALIDNYKAQLLAREAELYAIRTGLEELFDHPWMPSPDAIRQAVHAPSSALRAEYLERYAKENR